MFKDKEKILAEIAALKQVLIFFDAYGIEEQATARAIVVGMIEGKEKFIDYSEKENEI